MMFRAVAVATLACLSLPVAAQEMSLVDHVANLMFGLQAGYRAADGDVVVPIKQMGPGVFEVSGEGIRTTTTTITELEPCVFNYEGKRGTRSPLVLQLHFRKLIDVGYVPRTTDANGLTTIVINEEVEPGFIIRDGEPVDERIIMQSLATDIPVASLDASVAALKAACPAGGDPSGGSMEIVDHLASVMLGLTEGYHVPAGSKAVPIVRTGPGMFEVSDTGMDFKVKISEVEPCLYEAAMTSFGNAAPLARVDATKLTSVTYSPTKSDAKFTTYTVTAVLEPGFKTLVGPDGSTRPDDDLPGTIQTDTPLDLLNASVAAVQAACP